MLNKRNKLIYIVILTIIITTISVSYATAESDSTSNEAFLNINGKKVVLDYLKKDNQLYFSLINITNNLGIDLIWNGKKKCVEVEYSDGSEAFLYINKKRLVRESLGTSINVFIKNGTTYISKEDLKEVINHRYYWDDKDWTLYTYLYAYPTEGKSLLADQRNNGISAEGDSIKFNIDGLPKIKWDMSGSLIDFRLLGENEVLGIKEYRYGAFYQAEGDSLSQIVFTQRILPNDDQMLLITSYSADNNIVLSQQVDSNNNEELNPAKLAHGSDFYIYKDKGTYHEYIEELAYSDDKKIKLAKNQSVDNWLVLSKEDLALEDPYALRAWELSEESNDTNKWINASGTNTDTPEVYKNNYIIQDNNFNLQATTPALILESYQISKNRLLEDIAHNGAYTLVNNQSKDGLWYSGISVAYLNRSYQLGPEFIDTRMSVDASLFLLRYGLLFDNDDAIECGKNFKNYFKLLQDKNLVYTNGEGTLYPDYYSPRYKGKTLVSLNHALYEMQYLYTIDNWFGDKEAKELADSMLVYIENTSDKWVTPKGDLHYAYSKKHGYYGKDYINVTYVDLFLLKSILNYQHRESKAVDNLFTQNETYLKEINSDYYESKINVDYIFDNFDKNLKNKGDLFVSYPVEIVKEEGKDFAYSSYGAYIFVKGVNEVTHKGHTLNLDPQKKYLLTLTKGGIKIVKSS